MKIAEIIDTERQEVKAILDKHGIKSTYDIEYGSDAFSDLFDYFSSDPDGMPYGVQKARTGMPDEWIADRLIDLGLLKETSYEPFPQEDEMTFEDDDAYFEAFGYLGYPEEEIWEAEYRGRKVPLNKPMRGDVKKFKVYVKDPKSGNVKKVNFGHGGSSARRAGQKTMKIRKSNPKARKSFRARHNCDNPGPKTKARYWSCRKW
jgi:hypothetical protein